MKLHLNEILFKQAIIATAQQFGSRGIFIPEVFIEKDYWVTVALSQIFKGPTGTFCVFKGGTSLSKCFSLIDRFSEDIDIVLLQDKNATANQQRNRLKAISNSIEKLLPEVYKEGITRKFGMIRKTVHQFPKLGLSGVYGQANDTITVESSWLSSSEPYVSSRVDCYIAQMMINMKQYDLVEEYDLQPIELKAVSIERTFCEKIMSLVRFSHSNTAIDDLKRKIRHIYDLHKLMQTSEIKDFLSGDQFEIIIRQIGEEDMSSFRNNNKWLSIHPKDAIIFNDPQQVWRKIRSEYTGTFKDMVTVNLPDGNDLLLSLTAISKRLNYIEWNIPNQ